RAALYSSAHRARCSSAFLAAEGDSFALYLNALRTIAPQFRVTAPRLQAQTWRPSLCPLRRGRVGLSVLLGLDNEHPTPGVRNHDVPQTPVHDAHKVRPKTVNLLLPEANVGLGGCLLELLHGDAVLRQHPPHFLRDSDVRDTHLDLLRIFLAKVLPRSPRKDPEAAQELRFCVRLNFLPRRAHYLEKLPRRVLRPLTTCPPQIRGGRSNS